MFYSFLLFPLHPFGLSFISVGVWACKVHTILLPFCLHTGLHLRVVLWFLCDDSHFFVICHDQKYQIDGLRGYLRF